MKPVNTTVNCNSPVCLEVRLSEAVVHRTFYTFQVSKFYNDTSFIIPFDDTFCYGTRVQHVLGFLPRIQHLQQWRQQGAGMTNTEVGC